MKKALAVARWEYTEKIKSKAFLISLFLMPALMIGFGVLPTLLTQKADSSPRVIGIIDAIGGMGSNVEARLAERYKLPDGQPNYIIRLLDADGGMEQAKQQADRLIVAEEIEGYLILPKTIAEDSTMEYRSENVGNFRLVERLTATVRDLVFEKKLSTAGVDPKLVRELSSRIEVRTVKVTKAGEEESRFEQIFLSAYLFVMMMFFLVATSGQLLVRSVVEEKANRVVEILVSSCTSTDLMAGKILGLAGLGLTQVAIWALIGLVFALRLSLLIISPGIAGLLLIYFVLGYLFYAAIFVAAGSPLSTEQEAQQVTSYLVLILILPLVLAIYVVQNPDAMLVKVLTFIPLLTPTMMAIRIPIQMPSVGEILGSIALLSASTAVAMWAAGRIFKTAILAYGKRPSISELWKLIRTAN